MARSVQDHLRDAALSCFGLLRRFVIDGCRQAVHRGTTAGEGGGAERHHQRRRGLDGRR